MSRSPTPRSRLVGAGSFALSLAGHVLAVGVGAYLVSVFRPAEPAFDSSTPRSEIAVDMAPIELPSAHAGPPLGAPYPDESIVPREPVVPGGGEPLPRPDTGLRGRGGAKVADAPAENLADRDEGLRLTREENSRIDRDQIQRLRTAPDRASQEDRRSSREPMELIFLATGSGHVAERRPNARFDPSLGALVAPAPAVLGSIVGAPLLGPGEFEPRLVPGGKERGGEQTSPGMGLLHGEAGRDHRSSAPVALGRPLVPKGPPSIPATVADRPRDNLDSEQEVAATVQSLVHASSAGGLPGEGVGGEEGPGATGSGGPRGEGSRAAPIGGGSGPFTGLSDTDPRVSAYRRSVLAKIYPLWENAFPKSAALDGHQGRAIISLVIFADGHVDDVRVVRRSGVPEFDENVRVAVVRAAPFGPFPPSIPGPSMRWSITFDANNPVVR